MSMLQVTTGDANCRYLAAPGTDIQNTQFGNHLASLGIRLPDSLPLQALIGMRWITPRHRIALPHEALCSWTDFPLLSMQGTDACPEDQAWAFEAWTYATCLLPDRENRPVDKLWQYWLDDRSLPLTRAALAHAVDPHASDGALRPIRHPRLNQEVLPWIDFFADWQAYHLAELLAATRVTGYLCPGQDQFFARIMKRHSERVEPRALRLAQRWQEIGRVFDWISSYRTVLANCATRDTFTADTRLGAKAWADQHGITADQVRHGIRDTMLALWQRWHQAPPVPGNALLRRLQQDIQYATRLLTNLTDEPTNPFDPLWYWRNHSKAFYAQLIEALPYEEWLAQRDFPDRSVHYQRGFPHPFICGADQIAQRIGTFWPTCAPLRRFCLAWVRLHSEMQGRDRDLLADATIQANERIEQFNLIALHTERILRHVEMTLDPTKKNQDSSNEVILAAVRRSLAAMPQAIVIAQSHLEDLVRKRTSLHKLPDPSQAWCRPTDVASNSADADTVVAAHVNALIARNYAAHHDYLDERLIYPSRDENKPHPGGTLLSSCLLVVLAALHTLAVRQQAGAP